MDEIKQKLGWPHADEAGKFYPPGDHMDTWYCYASRASDQQSRPRNKLASICLGQPSGGDLVVVRSSPAGIDDYEDSFTKMDLKRVIEYYRTADPQKVFTKREGSRLSRKMGMPSDWLDGVPHVHVHK